MDRPRPLAVLDGLSLAQRGSRLSWEVYSGEAYAVMGPQGARCEEFLDVVAGELVPDFGRAILASRWCMAQPLGGRKTPQAAAGEAAHGDATRVVEVLTGLGLWEARQTQAGKLDPALAAAAELIPVLAGEEEVMLVPGQLDLLDPWTLHRILALLIKELSAGRCLLASTAQPSLAAKLGRLILLREGEPRYAGTVEDLIAEDEATEWYIETDDASTARSLVAPFEVHLRQTPEGLVMKAPQGQDLAARLLRDGYGFVRAVTQRRPTLEEALLRRIR